MNYSDFFKQAKKILKKNKYIKLLIQLLLLILLIFVIRSWQARGHIEGAAPVILGSTLKGQLFDLREQQGKPILVHFWATWCGVCKLENSNIANLAKDYPVITIASWSDGAEQVKQYIENEQLDFPVIVDEDGEWAKVYGVKAVPASFIVDGKGRVKFVEVGYTTEIGLRLRLWWLQ